MSTSSGTPILTPSRSPSPELPVQPDHFYGSEGVHLPPSPDSDGKTWLDPNDDPLAHRGIPVFKPNMDEFKDFEGYMNKIEPWGMRSGIVKVIPPKEWSDALPSIKPQLKDLQIKRPIEQHMFGRGGLFRQENLEKRKFMSVREWVELCRKEEYRAPGVQEVGLHGRSSNVAPSKPRTLKGKKKAGTVKAESSGPAQIAIKEEPMDDYHQLANSAATRSSIASPSNGEETPDPPSAHTGRSSKRSVRRKTEDQVVDIKHTVKGKRASKTKEARDIIQAERATLDRSFIDSFEPHVDWLPPNTKPSDYTPEFCQKLERQYWRNCSLGRPAWYGADTQGSLYTNETTAWNVAHLPSTLSRLLPSSDKGLPGVNTPYLYFGMWRATFAWHVEDMDLFSINYIHFGAPKFWYAIPQGRAAALEQTMRGYFPKDTSQCPQFLRHKSFLASPSLLAQSSCRPNHLVQHAGEFVITYPRGYHAGFNLGINCAESVNFALESWLELGRRAKACECISDSVRIDVDQLLEDRAREAANADLPSLPAKASKAKKDIVKSEVMECVIPPPKNARKRKSESKEPKDAPKLKKIKIKPSAAKSSSSQSPSKPPFPKLSITLKLGPKPAEPEPYPCCLCISMSKDGLLRVQDPPVHRKDAVDAAGNPKKWMAHEICANIVPETWVDEIDTEPASKERVVFGVDGIVKDRWNLKCSSCTKNKPKGHGAPVQCTKGKCPKAFHVSCARDGAANGLVFQLVREVEKEVVLLEPAIPCVPISHMSVDIPQGSVAMTVDVLPSASNPAHESPDAKVLKVIKKLEAQVLCTQHNPAIAAAKKANKQDKIRSDLLALPSMSRIKVRVSAGVFEVSLVRVMEETKSVEVLWDRGLKREFKWGSVVFGSTEGPVQQKPSEPAVEPERLVSVVPVTTYPSVSAATATCPSSSFQDISTPASLASTSSVTSTSQTPAQSNATSTRYGALSQQYLYPSQYNYWAYGGQPSQYSATPAPYAYGHNGYYQNAGATQGSSQQLNSFPYPQAYNQAHFRGGQLNWQQPYQGPQGSGATSYYAHVASQSQSIQTQGSYQPLTISHAPAASVVLTHSSTTQSQPPLAHIPSGSINDQVAHVPTPSASLQTPPTDSTTSTNTSTSASLKHLPNNSTLQDTANCLRGASVSP
ncbi:JmjC domain, hydroxylase-domain-containing protein [Cyathus striatus]|nr:JmjC domain, hydroxylase-domain-containing protein [Cyathus striatus]